MIIVQYKHELTTPTPDQHSHFLHLGYLLGLRHITDITPCGHSRAQSDHPAFTSRPGIPQRSNPKSHILDWCGNCVLGVCGAESREQEGGGGGERC